MPKIRLYLAGPMSGIKDKNKFLFNKVAIMLRKKGFDVINPWELDANDKVSKTWEQFLIRDLKQLLDCNVIVTLPDWQESRGATLEVFIATQLKKQVISSDYYLERKTQ